MDDHAKTTTGVGGPGGDSADEHRTVPEENQAGHHPEHDQDKPDLDAYAERLGIDPS